MGRLTTHIFTTEVTSLSIPYYDSIDGKLLTCLSLARAEKYVNEGIAKAVFSKTMEIMRLYSIPRERVYRSAAHAAVAMHLAASKTTKVVRFASGVSVTQHKPFVRLPVLRQRPLPVKPDEKTMRNQERNAKLLLRGPEVAEVLGISVALAYRWMRHGVLPVVRQGYSVRVPQDALSDWVRSRTNSPAAVDKTNVDV